MTEEEQKALEWLYVQRGKYYKIAKKYIQKQQADIEIKDKVIDLMAEQLTTPVHNKEWVINYFEEKAK